MALKIGGTTVINDSRGLENISNLKTVNGQSILGTGDIAVSTTAANSTDAQLRDRSTHTGVQSISTIDRLSDELSWRAMHDHMHSEVTAADRGFMSSTDKIKLDGLPAVANNYVHPDWHPASMIAEDETKQFVTAGERSNWNQGVKRTQLKTINGQEIYSMYGGEDLTISAGAVSADSVTETANRVFITPQQKQAFSNAVHYETGYVPKNQFKTINGQAIYDQWGGDLTVSGSPDFTSSKNITIGGKGPAGMIQGAVRVGFGGGHTITNPNTDPMTGGGGTIYTAGDSTAVGKNALFMNNSGNFNTAVGSKTLQSNYHGSHNTAIGSFALANNDDGMHNTAIGSFALFRNTWGMENIAIGKDALFRNEGGGQNIAIGAGTLCSGTSANSNVAIGTAALQFNTGDSNTAIGDYALSANTSGAGNIAIGAKNSSSAYAPVFNPTTENDRVVMGSTAVTNAYIQVAWTVVSDARDKTNFQSIPHGLDFVKQLKPTAYQFRESRGSEVTNGGVRYGFKAQDIAAIEPEGIVVDVTNPEKLYYNESNLIPILTKAIQELSQKYDAVLAELAELKNK